jgi:hypothetical protein
MTNPDSRLEGANQDGWVGRPLRGRRERGKGQLRRSAERSPYRVKAKSHGSFLDGTGRFGTSRSDGAEADDVVRIEVREFEPVLGEVGGGE